MSSKGTRDHNSTHYSIAQKPAALWEWASVQADEVNSLRKPGTIAVLAYRGMSGIAAATALELAYAMKHPEDDRVFMVYVRKPGERSHGSEVEHNLKDFYAGMARDVEAQVFFVDDFISSGSTFTSTMKAVSKILQDKGILHSRDAVWAVTDMGTQPKEIYSDDLSSFGWTVKNRQDGEELRTKRARESGSSTAASFDWTVTPSDRIFTVKPPPLISTSWTYPSPESPMAFFIDKDMYEAVELKPKRKRKPKDKLE